MDARNTPGSGQLGQRRCQRVNGRCHCGAVRFEADLDLAGGGFRCNCSICTKLNAFVTTVVPGAFAVLSGQQMLNEYVFGPRRVRRFFCKTCSVLCYARISLGDSERIGINLNALEGVELNDLKVAYLDGRHDDFTPHDAPPSILARAV
jgi:hypothetical protein